MNRVRLTSRKAADMSIPYPGNVNQPDRKDPSWEQYHTFEQRVNHELPDMRHEWKDDDRDDIGFGVPEANPPTVAGIRVAANKAVRIAVLLLGEKVEDEVIEAQARDFMGMNGEAMDRTLDRFAKTQKFYAEDEEDADEKKASAELADKMKDKKSEDKSEDKGEEKKAEGDKKEMPEFIKEKIEESKKDKDEKKDEKKAESKKDKDEKKDEKKAESKKDKDEKKADDKSDDKDEKDEKKAEDKSDDKEKKAKRVWDKDEKKWVDAADKSDDKDDKNEKKAEDKKDEDEKKAADEDEDEDESKKAEDKDDDKADKKVGMNEMDIELTGAVDEDVSPDPESDKQLASLFADGITAAEDEEDKADEKKAKKAGIKKLGGQPKVASEGGESADISSIWNTAPDVSEIFR